MDNYADIFTLENEGNKEIIFACVEQRGISLQLWHDHALPGNFPVQNTAIQRWMVIKYLGRFTIHLRMETIV